jgi:hypothetical protein
MRKTILILVTIFFLTGCSKEDDNQNGSAQLPAETMIGANTFGCYINGKLVIPRDGSGTFGGPDRAVYFWADPTGNQQYSEIDVRDYKSEKTSSILIHIQNLNQNGAGNYIVDESNGNSNIDGLNHNYIHCRVYNETTNSYQYYRSFQNSGLIKITRYDINNRIISGTFSCKLRNSVNVSDEIEVTNGRFDFKWSTLDQTHFP